MIWETIVKVVVLSLSLASATELGDIPPQLKRLIPVELRDFIADLSVADISVLVELYKNSSMYNREEEIMAAIKAKSPATAAKIEKFQELIGNKVAALGPEAKAFAEEILGNARKVHAQHFAGRRPSRDELLKNTLDRMNRFKMLSAAGKADFQKQFPSLANVLGNEQLAKFLENNTAKVLENNN
ncbi:nematode fatty acid retinoid binding protein [Ancylostoma caninum]|uniref:Fatty-acid and retinol-binding protein 1 n=1 Tax=Ancylostoma caninum TaxID=29170 RepID=A0A368G694_ANCCA|nr:nematode fatty acid retinoid binding protein [Ancylostoma caninum]